MKKISRILIATALLASCGGKTNRYDATGTFEADCITVSAQTAGPLLSLSIEEGDTLSANQIVALIDTASYALLAHHKPVPDLQREQARLNVERCHVASPISGVVLQLFKHAGEQAAAGMPLFQVADVEHMTLHCYFTSEQLSRLTVGQQVTVFCDYGGSERYEYPGTLTWISPQAEFTPKSILTNNERANQVYAAKVSVKNDGKIKIGMYGGVVL